jgi:DNA-binding MarR family transcriptional regulator
VAVTATLTHRQFTVLRYLADAGRATARDVTAALRANRGRAQNSLRDLAAKGLVAVDPGAYPASYEITDEGREALADAVKAAEGGES